MRMQCGSGDGRSLIHPSVLLSNARKRGADESSRKPEMKLGRVSEADGVKAAKTEVVIFSDVQIL